MDISMSEIKKLIDWLIDQSHAQLMVFRLPVCKTFGTKEQLKFPAVRIIQIIKYKIYKCLI